jgi:hypothetical protein
MRHHQLKDPNSFDVVDALAVAETGQAKPAQPERAVPDVPAAIGLGMIAVYTTIVALFALTIATAGQGPFMIAIDLMFLAAFFTVPIIILKAEKDPARRPSMSRFLAQGMQTYTGHISGGGAITQMFVVPICLAFGVLAIGLIVLTA